MRSFLAVFCLIFVARPSSQQQLPPSCPSQIYCQGQLLHDVQLAQLYPDSKTFVDLRLKSSPQEVINAYDRLKRERNGTVQKDELKSFVETHFQEGDELEVWTPTDWTETPSIAHQINDSNIRNWTLHLNRLWKTLSRKIKSDVRNNPDRYSLIYVPQGFVIPGGRFRELYYWDTYWIIKGLLLCDMHRTAKGVIENLVHLVDDLGHMPNGNRVYYRERSQPPLLTQMVDHYVRRTGDTDFIRKVYPTLKNEMKWWLARRRYMLPYNGKNYLLFRYYAPSSGPRPESYREDYETAWACGDGECTTPNYIALKSAAESGFDFSTRWIIKDGSNNGNLSDIDTGNIIPVDLNAFIHKNLKILFRYALIVGDKSFKEFSDLCRELQKSINEVLYDEQQGVWFDYDLKNNQPRKYFYLSNITPLWTKSYDLSRRFQISSGVLRYLQSVNIESYPGGSPTSLVESGQQWDFPNAWPPLQAILVYGLDRLRTPEAEELAEKLATTWVRSNYKAFQKTSHMFEKYNSNECGGAGGGGEYDVQAGFGWTNGVILEMLNSWPTISSS